MTNAFALLALLALPAIVVLHLFRRTRRERRVSALFLWSEAGTVSSSGARRQPLKRNLSLILELLAATAIAFTLAGPHGCSERAPTHLLVILDDSASMSAVVDGQSAAERARAGLLERIEQHPSALEITLIASGEPPRLLCAPRSSARTVAAALLHYQPVAAHHDLGPACKLARSYEAAGAVLVCTDRFDRATEAADIEVLACGRAAPNWAISRAQRKVSASTPQLEQIELEIASFAAQAAQFPVRIERIDGARVIERDVALQAYEVRSLSLELAASSADLIAVLEAPSSDALRLDDRVDLPWKAPREVRIFIDAPQDDLLALRFERRDGSRFDPAGLGAASNLASSPQACDLYIGAGQAPQHVANALCWYAPGSERSTWNSPFLIERGARLMQGLSLEGLQWTGDPHWRPPGRALMRAGDSVLISMERTASQLRIHLNCDPHASTLGVASDWPILLSNLVSECTDALEGPRNSLVALGTAPDAMGIPGRRYQWLDLQRATALELVAAMDGTLALPALEHVGRFALHALEPNPSLSSGPSTWHVAAALLDERESNLAQATSGQRGHTRWEAPERHGERDFRAWLGALFCALVIANWYWLARHPDTQGGRASR